MPNTTNFNWATPADTDLVKDGAAAIRTLGNNIDASLVDLKGGTTGQILSKASNTDLDYTWINNDQGDITAVNAGTGLTGGGTTGSVSLSLSVPVTEVNGGTNQTTYATGDLLFASASNTLSKRTIGTTGQILTVSGGVPTWATPTGSSKNYSLLNAGGTALTGAQTITVSGISGQDSLFFFIDGGSSANAGSRLEFTFNGDSNTSNYAWNHYRLITGASYSTNHFRGDGIWTGTLGYFQLALMSNSASSLWYGSVEISGANTTGAKMVKYAGGGTTASSDSNEGYIGGGVYLGTSAISSITVRSSSGNFDAGRIYVYGAS